MRSRVWVGLTAMIILAWPMRMMAADEDKEKEKAVAEQKKTIEALWKRVMDDVKFTHKETDNFLIYATLEKEELETIAKALEKAFPAIKKQASLGEKNELWPGKLVICAFDERAQFTVWLRNAEKRMVGKTDSGSFKHEREYTVISAGPPAASVESYPVDMELINQLASATMSKGHKDIPEWIVTGFGRSAMYRYAPKNKYIMAERKYASDQVKLGRMGKDVWGGKLNADEAPILYGSMIDFLVNSQQVGKHFNEIINNYGSETPFEDALKAAKLQGDRVDAAWRAWVPTQR